MADRCGRGREPQRDMEAAHLLELLDLLAGAGVDAWLDGGWCIDALLGEQTRPHDDLDLIVPIEGSARVEEALGARGYALAGGGPPLSFMLVDPQGRQVDAHPVAFTATGDGVYRMDAERDWVYPARGFAGRGRVLGREVRCLTPEIALLCHATGYELDAAHRRDVEALAARYALEIPLP